MKRTGHLGCLIKKVALAWSEDNVPRLSAALAYYTIFALAPLLIIGITFAGLLFGPEASRGQVVGYISNTVGFETGRLIQSMLVKASAPKTAKLAQMFGVVVLLVGAVGIFAELQSGLNTIWKVKAKREKNWLALIYNRLLSFLMVLGAAVLLMACVILDMGLTLISAHLDVHLAHSQFWFVTSYLSTLLSFLMITLLFGLLFKVLPDLPISWRAIWIGALMAAVLFTFGKVLLGFYLSHSSVLSIYGASGSFVVLLIWIYYTAQIFFIGAEISKVVAEGEKK